MRRAGALLLATACAAAVPPGAAAERKTEAVRVAPDRVRITLRLEFHGEGLARTLAALRAGERPSLMELSWAPWAGVQARHIEAVHAAATRYGWWR